MEKFIVIYAKGHLTRGGGGDGFQTQPGKHQLEVTASNKMDAYLKALEHFTALGLKVTVDRNESTGLNAIGFSEEEVAALREKHIDFTTTYSTGVRIQKIVPGL